MKSITINETGVIIIKNDGTQLWAELLERRDNELLIVYSQKLIRISRTENGYSAKVIREGVILR